MNNYLPDISLVSQAFKVVYEKIGMNVVMEDLRKKTEEIKLLKNKIEQLENKLDKCYNRIGNLHDTYFCETCDDIILNIDESVCWCNYCNNSFCEDCSMTCIECDISYCKNCINKDQDKNIFHEINDVIYCIKCYDNI